MENDIANIQEVDFLTSSSGYGQIIDKPTPVVNNTMSCIDLTFCTKNYIISNHVVDVTIFEKCHGKSNIWVPLSPVYILEVWDYSKAISKIRKKHYPILIRLKL